MTYFRRTILTITACCGVLAIAAVPFARAEEIYHLYEGITAYVHNPEGKEFQVGIDLRDLNLFADGPREVLLKIYDPSGKPIVREIIPDDGVASPNFPGRIGGWDHELQYYANLYAKGTHPSFRWSAWSDPKRLQTIVARTITHSVPGGMPGVYRIVLAGTRDHYATLRIDPELRYGVAGHTTWMHGHGDLLKTSYIYVPQDTTGLFVAVAEPDLPRTRHFRLTAPDGKVLFDGTATGGYATPQSKNWQQASLAFDTPGQYDGKLLRLDVSDGAGDYLVKVTLQQPRKGPFAEYVGMGSSAVFAPDEETALALRGGTTVVDGQVFWHPFQIRFYQWLKAHPLDGSDEQKALRAELQALLNGFRLIETSDGRGSASWTNWAYAFGYYGCKIWRPAWLLMQRDDVPQEVKEIIREGLIMGGDRLSFAVSQETVNGNAFSQINVALWYCHRATGDPMQKERFELFWKRWTSEGWGRGVGLSPSGDSQEHFAHDMHYGSYLLDNWRGITWVKQGILDDATDDPRFAEVIERYRELYSYLYCREKDGRPVAANPWSARTHAHAHNGQKNWEIGPHTWKGEPGPDFTVSVNGGNEWFAARRKNYYALTYHGRIGPDWMCQSFSGQLGFSGGILCQLTVPGRGPVLASTLAESYGVGMHPSNWRNFHIHSIVGERWDGHPIVAAISEHENARLEGTTVRSSGEVRDAHVKVTRSYTFGPDHIDCTAQLAESDYGQVLSIWSHERKWSEMRVAFEMIPFMPKAPDGTPTEVTLEDEADKPLGPATADPQTAQTIKIDRGGFWVSIHLDKPRPVQLGASHTVLIRLTDAAKETTPAAEIGLAYRLLPFAE